MMKKWCALLFAVCLMLGFALAESAEEQCKEHARNLLTEVYGYTVEESTAFEFETTDENGKLQVRFWPVGRPEWVYSGVFDAESGRFRESQSPFTRGMRMPEDYPGESAVREVLRSAQEDSCFQYWHSNDRNELLMVMRKQGVQPTSALMEGIVTGQMSGGEALHAFFESCYGPEMGWNKALREWYEETLAVSEAEWKETPAFANGIATYTYQPTENHAPITVTRFTGEAPAEVKAMLDNPNLAGWTPICGVLQASAPSDTLASMEDQGMLAFEKDGQRLLVALERKDEKTDWTLHPISLTALRTDVDMYIEPGSELRSHSIVYRLSETETERFLVRTGTRRMENLEGLGCSLLEYSRMDSATGEGFWLDVASGSASKAVVYHADGRVQEETITAPIPYSLEWLDVNAFPTTLTQCWQLKADELPHGYALSGGVHLRASTSSRGKDLGNYENGVLVKILGQEPGDPYPWYRVRVGSREGYMCSIYVHDDAQAYANRRAPVGKTTKEVRLKDGASLLSRTVQTLPEGTRLHVLADCGSKLHVMIMEDENAPMPTSGVDGYLPKDAVQLALTALQLEWQ